MNENAQIKDLEDKYVFWDIDGTLAPYRFNNHVANPNGTNNGMSLKEIEDGVFLTRKPSKHMQNVLGTCNAKENIVMGHCQVKKEMEEILQYCKTHNIDLNDVVYVDDVISFLREAERKGIKSYHISSFLDWDYQFISSRNDYAFSIHNG